MSVLVAMTGIDKSYRSRVLIMDEPTAALNDAEIHELFTIIGRLKAEGVGIVYISHNMDELKRIADRVTVMRDGEYVGTVPAAGTPIEGSQVVVIGFDSGAAQKGMVESGLMGGAITQNPVGIGYETVKAAVTALDGGELPEVIDTGFFFYDASNMNDPEIAAVLYN